MVRKILDQENKNQERVNKAIETRYKKMDKILEQGEKQITKRMDKILNNMKQL